MEDFLGTRVFPRRGRKINICLAGVVNVLIEKKNYTIIPMNLVDIYLAFTVCQRGKRFFEGCNILLQLWIVEHLYRPPTVARFIQDQSDYIMSHAKRVEKYRCLERVNAWVECFRSPMEDKITWNYPWGVQPYIPLRVLRQLGRRQILPITDDMKDFMSKVRPEVPLPEGLAKKIWEWFIVMGIGTMVRLERSVKEPIDHEAEIKIKGQINLATIRGAQIAELAVSQQQQLRAGDHKIQTNFDQERAQWIRERGRLQEELESVLTQERRAR
ncbi:hypothetical protein H5410_040538 [Solanum commersonii]|uniref:Aminotransferase-like plant mobile domain-containing protein n=1 Tax=Solanum commersonii TaxID=4109 RepID=A0A9J5XS97_SOLCO|nr:hypothetical protein H5410_040538 [Solanum commersonii]